jgi:hypothetical protein
MKQTFFSFVFFFQNCDFSTFSFFFFHFVRGEADRGTLLSLRIDSERERTHLSRQEKSAVVGQVETKNNDSDGTKKGKTKLP